MGQCSEVLLEGNITGNTVYVFHVNDGKISDAWAVPANQYGLDEFWAD